MIDKTYLVLKRTEIQKECITYFYDEETASKAKNIQFDDEYDNTSMTIFIGDNFIEVHPKNQEELVLMTRFSAYDCLINNMINDLI